MTALNQYLEIVLQEHDLDIQQAGHAFQIIMNGGATPAQMAAFLVGLRCKGESVAEIIGATQAIRLKAVCLEAPEGAIDTCGTGGDNSGSLNVSTAVAFVVAACGVPVAKHGNRSISSRSGSADVLHALGINIEVPKETVERCLREINIGFMMAPRYHTAMRHVAPVRTELGVRTIFNLLGPLTNPANTKRQLIGVYENKWVEPIAQVLRELDTEKAWVVHGSDGMDELTITGNSYVAALEDGHITTFEISPQNAGLEFAEADAIAGGDALHNAHALEALLRGEVGAYRDIVLLNSAAALMVAGRASTLTEGVEIAAEAIDSRRAQQTLASLVSITNEVVESTHS